jgi:murein DD-endopeptidase MepM/ murein hydrolase activator NlpD
VQKFLIINFVLLKFISCFASEVPQAIKPGQVLKVTLTKDDSFTPVEAFCGKDKILFEDLKDKAFFFFAPSYFSNPGIKINCGFIDKNKNTKNISILEIIDGAFPEEKLSVDPSKVVFSKKALRQIARDRKILNQIYNKPHLSALFKESFGPPMESELTSHYGGRRVFNGHRASQHLGIDYRAKIGTIVKSTNAGKIVLSQHLFFTGETIIIDHGLGIFSMYGHLSKLLVKKGQLIEKGSHIALSGATGRVSGPHLHWGIKMNHNWVNPLTLIEASLQ